MTGARILGVHAGINASACLSDGRRILYCVQEERLTGNKGYIGFPHHAVEACLAATGTAPEQVTGIAHGSTTGPIAYCSRTELTARLARFHHQPRWRAAWAEQRLRHARDPHLVPALRAALATHGLAGTPLSCYDHHTTHAATAYFGLRTDPTRAYLVLTCDGFGDGTCATVSVWRAGVRTEIARTDLRNSLGLLYFWTTQAHGFHPHQDEYKLMGMAPYADPDRAGHIAGLFREHLHVNGLTFHRTTRASVERSWPALARSLAGHRFDDVFAGLQLFTEQTLATWTTNAITATGIGDVLAGGGVFMNVKANKTIADLAQVTTFHAFPSCGDESLSIGAAYLHAATHHGPQQITPLTSCYLGDDITADNALAALNQTRYEYTRPTDPARTVARLLASGQAVAVCTGRMEFGARALGHRSILADPADADLPRRLNHLVKRRDFWMPFAPAVLASRHHDYLHNPKHLPSPHMTMAFETTDRVGELIAAVHPRDLTCRAQIVPDTPDSLLARTLTRFQDLTGRGVLLNTSLNLHGQPIARTATDALAVLDGSQLRHLLLGPFLVTKPDPGGTAIRR